jgi:hypothetical protein
MMTETVDTIIDWAAETFGDVTPRRLIERAREEFDELEAATTPEEIAEEAADVFIVLCRIPGFEEAVQRKMAINRTRTWVLNDDGTGNHVRSRA